MADERFEDERALAEALACAYDRMGPSEEAEARMWENIAQARGDAPAARRERRAWRIALPIAACLVLLAGAGVFATWQNAMNIELHSGSAASEAMVESASGGSNGAESAPHGAEGRPSGLPQTFPQIDYPSEGALHIAIEDGEPIEADPASVVGQVGEALAYNKDRTQSQPVAVFATDNAAHPYAVRYASDERYYRADPADGGDNNAVRQRSIAPSTPPDNPNLQPDR